MKVSIFGMGYVGAVSGACFSELGHEIVGVDPNPTKLDLINAGRSPVIEDGVKERIAEAVGQGRMRATADAAEAIAGTDVSIISVGTPSAKDGTPNLAIIDAVLADIGREIRKKAVPHPIILRSTVFPGTTERHIVPALIEHSGLRPGEGLVVCFNPEFLREGSAVKDFYAPPFTVSGSEGDEGHEIVERLYAGIEAPVIRSTTGVAEAVKYISNAFHALKITFANEIGVMLKANGTDAREALRVFCEDRELNISPAYLRPGFAFGGSCLPKELRGVQALARNQGIEMTMLSQVLLSNERHVERAFQLVARQGRQKVALFGLAFKPGTDDLRESPLVSLAEKLIGKGYDLVIHDKYVELSRLTGANREFIEREIPHLQKLLTADPARALDGAATIVIGHAAEAEIQAIQAAYSGQAVIDLQGIKAVEEFAGETYEGICW